MFSWGSASRTTFTNQTCGAPGPGAYSPEKVKNASPMYTMTGRDIKQKFEQTPGPGAYTPRLPQKEANKFTYSMHSKP